MVTKSILSITVAVLLAAAGCTRETQVTSGGYGGEQRVAVGPGGTIPAGTTVWLNLDQRLSARHSRVGDPFTATVSQDVTSYDGELLIPSGARVRGHISDLRSSPSSGEPAVIGLAFDSINMGGVEQPFNASIVQTDVSHGSRANIRGRDVLAGAAVGAILGAVVGGGAKGAVVGGALGAGAGTLVSLGRGEAPAELPRGSGLQARIETPVRSLAAIRGPYGAY